MAGTEGGGKWMYYLLYSFAGGFIIAMFTYILLLWVMQIRVPRPLWLVPVFALCLGAVVSVIVWNTNEKRFRRIIKREVKAAT